MLVTDGPKAVLLLRVLAFGTAAFALAAGPPRSATAQQKQGAAERRTTAPAEGIPPPPTESRLFADALRRNHHATPYGPTAPATPRPTAPTLADDACDCGECVDYRLHDAGWQQPRTRFSDTWLYDWLGTRHTSTHGRAIGPGQPLRGTSWLNRPYGFSIETGALIMTGNPAAGVESGNDFFAAIHAGWDWDHYWGSQLRIGWSTPTLDNTALSNQDSSDNFFITDVSVVYYPWGDSRTRPYLRLGVGLTDVEFTNASLVRQQEQLFTVPIAIGIKHQLRRTLAWRAEFANNLAIGTNDADSNNNITLTFGLEGRFGGRQSGYWAWRPRGGGW